MVGGIRAESEGRLETPSAGFVLAGGDHFAFFLPLQNYAAQNTVRAAYIDCTSRHSTRENLF
jgi:hypothetical protein